jgi:Tol biopolymer transport system component
MTRRRTLYLPALIVAVVLMACAAAVLAVSEKAEAPFAGKNGRIAYASLAESGPVFESIYTINPGGGGKTKVTAGLYPSFSPDGKKIAYTGYDGHDYEIYIINPNGRGKFQLTHNNKDEFDPSYSPDGKKIAYSGLASLDRNGAESDIYTINAGGGGKTQVTSTDNAHEFHPSWGSRP